MLRSSLLPAGMVENNDQKYMNELNDKFTNIVLSNLPLHFPGIYLGAGVAGVVIIVVSTSIMVETISLFTW